MLSFQLILDALDKYAEQTGTNLKEIPFAEKVRGCDSPGSILLLLQENVKVFKDYRDQNRKFIDCLSPVIQFVHAFSAILGEAAGLVPFQPAKLIFVGINVLFTAAEGVSASYDALLELFECVGSFLKRLEIYTKIPLSPLMTEIIAKIMVELLSILAQAKKQVKQGRFKQFAKKLLGDSEIESIMRRLDRLTQDEARMMDAHILEVVYGLVNNMKVVMDGGEASTSAIRKTLVTMQDVANEMNKMNRDRLHEKSRNWLSPPDPSENQVIARRDNLDGSAVWFTRGSTFENWNANGCLLWIHGKPGSGKSILCSTIVEEAMALRDAGLGSTAFYYFDFRNTAKQDVRGLLSSLLVQLCAKSDPCYEILSRLYSACDNGSRLPDDKALIQCLKDMLELPQQPVTYLIVDALDECPNTSGVVPPRERVLNLVEDLVEYNLHNLRLCVTSRPEADILDALHPLASHTVSLHDEDGQKKDIDNYIASVVRSDRKMRKWRAHDQKLVIDTLSPKADGMFRWVFCQLEALRGCYPQALRRALDELPETLDATYERTLLGIEKAKQEYACRLFQCLAVSIRPLRVEELAEVLAVLLDTGEDSEYHVDWCPEDAHQAVLSTCSSLIAVVNVDGSSVVQFSHFSVKEFLTSSRLAIAGDHLSRYHILPHSAHAVLARASLSVLLNLGDRVDKKTIEKHPLAIYASRYWVDHAKFEGVSSSIQDLLERLFDADKPYFATWIWLYDVDRPWEGHMAPVRPTQPMVAPLYYAALCGLRNLVEYLATRHPGDVNASGGGYDTPLHAALAKREFDVAQVLLEHSANINSLDTTGRSSLHTASVNGHCDIVKFLLERQADVDIREDDTGWTPLHLATQNGELEICRLLLKHGAALDETTKDQETPLHVASRYGRLEISRFFIDQGANTMSKADDGRAPLHSASRYGHLTLVDMLLKGSVDINTRNANEETPLDLASGCGNLEVVRLLIQHGADVGCRDKQGWTPLHTAARNGRLDVVRVLLDLGTDVQSRNGNNDTPLTLASHGGHVEVSRILIEHGADVRSVDSVGQTSLHSASQGGHADVAKLLIDHGADANVQAADLWSPLHHASANGYLKVAELLLDHSAEVDVRNEDQKTPLDLASGNGNLDVARLLIMRGSNVNSQDNQSWTPSHSAARTGHLDVVKLLLDSGADIGMRNRGDKTAFDVAVENGKRDVWSFLAGHEGSQLEDSARSTSLEAKSQNRLADIAEPEPHLYVGDSSDENTSLLSAVEQGHNNTVQRLLDLGADVDERDDLLQTPLDVASKNGKLEIARTLIKYGADVNSRDTIGWTPLHTAARSGHVDVARLLLDNGADINAVQRNRQTPLHIASCNEFLEVARLLLERGANVHLRNAYGRTAFQEASTRGKGPVARLFLEYGVGDA